MPVFSGKAMLPGRAVAKSTVSYFEEGALGSLIHAASVSYSSRNSDRGQRGKSVQSPVFYVLRLHDVY